MIFEICFAISLVLGIYDCEYTVEVLPFDEVNAKWQETEDAKGSVGGYFNPNTKEIVISDLKYFNHEWKHAFCYNYWVFHMKHNHPTMCEPYPHFKLQDI